TRSHRVRPGRARPPRPPRAKAPSRGALQPRRAHGPPRARDRARAVRDTAADALPDRRTLQVRARARDSRALHAARPPHARRRRLPCELDRSRKRPLLPDRRSRLARARRGVDEALARPHRVRGHPDRRARGILGEDRRRPAALRTRSATAGDEASNAVPSRMIGRAAVRAVAAFAAAFALAACGGGRASGPLRAVPDASAVRHALVSAPSNGWSSVPLVQPVATVGGTVGIADGVWVSDAAAGLVQVVTARGAAAFPVAAPRVYGLAPEAPNGVVFATDAGYGVVEDAGLSQTFSARMSSGEALAPGEIQYLQSEGVIFLGGSQTQGAQCADTIFVFLAGGRSPQPYPGDPGSAPCGLPIHHLT